MIGWRDHQARFDNLELRNLAHARTLAGHAARSLDSVDAVLERLSDRLTRIMRASEPDLQILHQMLSHTAATRGQVRSLLLVAADGTVLADSRQAIDGGADLPGLERVLASLPSASRNRLAVVRFRSESGDSVLLAVRRIQAGYSATQTLLIGELTTTFFRGFYETVNAAIAQEVALLTADGTVLAATDSFLGEGQTAVGRDLSDRLPLSQLGVDPGQTFVSADWNRTVGLAWVDGWPLVVMVATDIRPLFWDWLFVAGALGMAALLVTGGTIVTLRLGARYLNRLAETENETRLHVLDLEMSRLQLQRQGEQAASLAEALYTAREQAEQAREEAEAAREQADHTRLEAEAARTAADHANQAKSEFLARMSHELRTPLNAILGFAEIMKEGIGAGSRNDTYTQYSQDIYESGSHLLSVINDILDLSKVEAGRFELEEEPVDLEYACRSVVRLVRETASKRGLKVAVDVPSGTPRIRSDQRVVRQMLLNLLSNSLKFTPAGGSVSVLVRRHEDGIAVSVGDTGVGIDEKHFAKVLEPFGQVRDPSTEAVQGTGLGLPLVKSFIEAQGGRFDLASAVGEGTTVTLRFPADRIILPPQPDKGAPAERELELSEAC